jgi:hypothetical protein
MRTGLRISMVLAAGVLGAALTDAVAEEKPLPKGSPVLTIGGRTAHWNRGTVVPERDSALQQRQIRFDRAMAFDWEMLSALPQHELRVVTPAGEGTYSGPLLLDVLKASGAEAGKVRLVGLDGSDTELKATELADQNWILALVGQGKPAGIGEFGPLLLMHKPASGATPSHEEIERWVSSVFYIEVL